MTDKLIRFATAFLLKQVGEGTQSAFWQKFSKSKLFGIILIATSVLAYALSLLNFEQASAGVSLGLGMIFIRQGQEGETAVVKDHLSAQDARLKEQDKILADILGELKKK